MNVLLLTNKMYANWLNDVCVDYMSEHLIFIIYEKEDFERFCKNLSYDIGVSFMYTHKIPAKEVNSHKWYNFHPGPLPEYKGRNLCYHAIMNGETRFGATLHMMDENFDTGPIIDVWHTDIAPYENAEDVYRGAIETAKAMFEDYFPQILEDLPFALRPNVGGTYYPKFDISDEILLEDEEKNKIRAIYFPPHYPKIEIGGVTYKIVRDE